MKKFPRQLYDLGNSPLGSCPPFLIINSNDLLLKNDKIYLARKYSWGVCNVEDENHSDIQLFHRLLYFSFLDTSVKITESIERDVVFNDLQNIKFSKGFFSGIFLTAAIGFIGLGIVKNKI